MLNFEFFFRGTSFFFHFRNNRAKFILKIKKKKKNESQADRAEIIIYAHVYLPIQNVIGKRGIDENFKVKILR